jgi:hypothetical protein
MSMLLAQNPRKRILAPKPESDGNEILDWLRATC